MTDTGRTRVAIACQGGGSHTAFTAGVLERLLGAGELSGVEVVGLSGTSGGAVCALLAWSALLEDGSAAALEEFRRIWVIQINPKASDGEPTSMLEIADRRNELAGNLSLHQELGFIEKVDGCRGRWAAPPSSTATRRSSGS